MKRLICPLSVLLVMGCPKAEPEVTATATTPNDAAVQVSAAIDSHHLDDAAQRTLSEIASLETTKDVTCWTSFRQLDSFIASGQYSNFATLAKIGAMKNLVRAAWEKASHNATGPQVTAADLKAAATVTDAQLADKRKVELAAFATQLGMKAYKDYRTTSEHWRVLLAVIQDEIYAGGTTTLKPLSADALPALADLATRLSLLLLQASGKLAQDERSPFIEASHVKRAQTTLATDLALSNAPRDAHPITEADLKLRLAPPTKALIEGKITALQTYNKDSKDLVADLNRVSKIPITSEALDVWMKDLQSFGHFVAGGYEPMQADNFLSDGSYAPASNLPKKPYVDAALAENVTMQLFPHVIMPNGDVKMHFEPNPGSPSDKPRKSEDILMLDYQQNAVRDTAVHWLVLQNVFKETPYAMDPFAAEYVSEVISMMMTHYILRGEKLARAANAKTIDGTIAKKVRDKDYVQTMPKTDDAKSWSPEQWKKKAQVMAAYATPLFKDVTKDSGLPTTAPKIPEVATPAAKGEYAFDIQQAMGAGIAIGDVNKDGYPDLFIAGEGQGRLYVNRGQDAPGKFVDATDAWGIPSSLDDSHGALLFDLDGDGDLDLLVLRSEKPSLILRQDAPGKFIDVSAKLGFITHRGAHVASVFDYDKDGDLDIYVGYYGSDESNRKGSDKRNLPSMDGRNGSPHQLWKMGEGGKYTEVGEKAGVADLGWTLATGAFDYDNDGDVDLVLANDFGADVFYRNRGDGTFEDVSKRTQTDDRGSGMNVSFTDVNGDGWLDFYVSNVDMFSKNIKVVYPTDTSTINNMDEALQKTFQYLSGNKLFVNPADAKGDRPFAPEQATRFEPGDRGWDWAATFFDYENDGDDDMYLSNGWLEGSAAGNQKKQMFVNDGGTYYLASPTSPEAFAGNSRSVVAFDMDRDGDLDLVVNNFRQAPVLLENVQKAGNHRVEVRLRGKKPNVAGIGARVTASAAGKKRIHEVTCGLGYLGQDDEVISIGVGKETTADLSVRWPSGKTQTVTAVATDRVIDVTEP